MLPLSSCNDQVGMLLISATNASTAKTLDLALALRLAGAALVLVVLGAAALAWRQTRRA